MAFQHVHRHRGRRVQGGLCRVGCGRERGRRKAGPRSQASSHALPRVRSREGRSRPERGFEVQQPGGFSALATDHLFPVPHISERLSIPSRQGGCRVSCGKPVMGVSNAPIEYLLAVWSSVNVLTSLSLRFLICEVGGTVSPSQQVSCWWIKQDGGVQCSNRACPAHGKPLINRSRYNIIITGLVPLSSHCKGSKWAMGTRWHPSLGSPYGGLGPSLCHRTWTLSSSKVPSATASLSVGEQGPDVPGVEHTLPPPSLR